MKLRMTSFIPDVNVWIALSDTKHIHNLPSLNWLKQLPSEVRVLFLRYTQIALLRLLTNRTVMGAATQTLEEAWGVYDYWVRDPRIDLCQEPRGLDEALRETTMPFAAKPASKWVGDCYLLACAGASGATLVTFDRDLLALARKLGYDAISPS